MIVLSVVDVRNNRLLAVPPELSRMVSENERMDAATSAISTHSLSSSFTPNAQSQPLPICFAMVTRNLNQLQAT